jgi:hypothetical protein
MKEKKKVFDTNNSFYKLLKFPKETNYSKKYELFNIISKTGNSIYSPIFEELTVMEQLELLRYAIESLESLLVSKDENQNIRIIIKTKL